MSSDLVLPASGIMLSRNLKRSNNRCALWHTMLGHVTISAVLINGLTPFCALEITCKDGQALASGRDFAEVEHRLWAKAIRYGLSVRLAEACVMKAVAA